jgi:hypothetical protein
MRPTRISVTAGTPVVVPVDYFNTNCTVQIVPVGGTLTVTATADDPNDPTYTAVYCALPAPLAAGIAANTLGYISLIGVRALKLSLVGGGPALVTILQGSGDGGIGA